MRIHDPKAVRPNDSHVAFPSFAKNVLLESRAPLANFLESGRDDDRTLNAGRNALANDLGNRSSRRSNHSQVDGFGRLSNAGIAARPEYIRAIWIDWIDAATERSLHEIGHDRASHTQRFFRGANYCNITRTEEDIQRPPPFKRSRYTFLRQMLKTGQGDSRTIR